MNPEEISRRNKFALFQAIFSTIPQDGHILITQLREKTGMQHHALRKYLDVIDFIQSQPKITRRKLGRIETLAYESDSPIRVEHRSQSSIPLPKSTPSSKNDPFSLLEEFVTELKDACKKAKIKIDLDRMQNAAQALLSKWQILDLSKVDGTTYPATSENTLIQRFSDFPENFSESLSKDQWEMLRNGLQECWDKFSALKGL
jgi:hypothetical protein